MDVQAPTTLSTPPLEFARLAIASVTFAKTYLFLLNSAQLCHAIPPNVMEW